MSQSKDKGTRGESAVVAYLRGCGWHHAERRALRGVRDAGDVTGIPGVVIEVKNTQAMSLAGWADELAAACRNVNADVGVVWHKRRGKGNPADWYVTMSGAMFTKLLRDARW